jgi:hypothetical protein
MAKKIISSTTKKAAVKKAPAKEVASKKAVVKKAAVKKTATVTKAPAARKDVPEKKAAVAKKVSQPAKTPVTKIVARVDVGYGNELYLRGEGAGLSWDKGSIMQCIGSNEWVFTTDAAKTGVVFKFLINDSHWADGEDVTVPAGGTSISAPSFS